jgi:hypothetical protein
MIISAPHKLNQSLARVYQSGFVARPGLGGAVGVAALDREPRVLHLASILHDASHIRRKAILTNEVLFGGAEDSFSLLLQAN